MTRCLVTEFAGGYDNCALQAHKFTRRILLSHYRQAVQGLFRKGRITIRQRQCSHEIFLHASCRCWWITLLMRLCRLSSSQSLLREIVGIALDSRRLHFCLNAAQLRAVTPVWSQQMDSSVSRRAGWICIFSWSLIHSGIGRLTRGFSVVLSGCGGKPGTLDGCVAGVTEATLL